MSKGKQCPEPDVMAALIDGRLPEADRKEILAHMDRCASCHELLAYSLFALEDLDATETETDVNTAPTGENKIVPISKKWLFTGVLSAAAVLIATLVIGLFGTYPKEEMYTAAWWLQQHPSMDPSESNAVRAQRVFDKVAAVADKQGSPALVILERDALLSLALKDEVVLVSSGLIELCYEAGTEQGDKRLAMVFGQELAHLYQNHFHHATAALLLEKYGDRFIQKMDLADLWQTELEAYRLGLFYADRANYDPAALLADAGSFFEKWVTQPVWRAALSTHDSPIERANALTTEMAGVCEELKNFQEGIRLYETGDFQTARSRFDGFYQDFPSKAVADRLGLTWYQEAAAGLSRRDLLRFRLPLDLAQTVIAQSSGWRGDPDGSEPRGQDFLDKIERAESYFRDARAKDPQDNSARLNLLSSMLLSGRSNEVIATRDEAVTDHRYRHAMALAYFNRGLEEEAIEQLRTLPWTENPEMAYNLARMLTESGRQAEAESAWRTFLDLEREGPFADEARRYLPND